jgi:hypothetical protein
MLVLLRSGSLLNTMDEGLLANSATEIVMIYDTTRRSTNANSYTTMIKSHALVFLPLFEHDKIGAFRALLSSAATVVFVFVNLPTRKLQFAVLANAIVYLLDNRRRRRCNEDGGWGQGHGCCRAFPP